MITASDWQLLSPCRVLEYGVLFETGVPVNFRYLRSTEPSPDFGSRYGQDIEPAGRYILHNPDPGDLARGWETGIVHFDEPLVIQLVTDDSDELYGPHGWKFRLFSVFDAKHRRLTCKIRREGFDAIVTCGPAGDTREIVDLSVVRC